MAMKIRLARGGSKKRPHYAIVATDSRMPRDGRFLEKLGTYNPLLPKDDEKRVQMDLDRVKHWLGLGAQPTDRVSRFLEAAGVTEKKVRNNPKAAEPGKAMAERAKEKAEKAPRLRRRPRWPKRWSPKWLRKPPWKLRWKPPLRPLPKPPLKSLRKPLPKTASKR